MAKTNDRPTFVYTTYIATTPARVWEALTRPELIRRYWFGMTQESTWKRGDSWKMVRSDQTVCDAGEVVESKKPKRLVLRWRHEWLPALRAEGFSTCTYDIEKVGKVVRLTITHRMQKPVRDSKFIGAVGGGWPQILSSLKSFLETGEPLAIPRG
jgi:uncharacterized protein YndB with AHSA1/START domain